MPKVHGHEGVAYDGCIVTFDQGMQPWFVGVACEAVRFWRVNGKSDEIVHCRWQSGRVLNMRIEEIV